MALPPQDHGGGGVDMRFPHAPRRVDDPEFIDPCFMLALERHADDLSAERWPDFSKNVGERHGLASFDRLTRPERVTRLAFSRLRAGQGQDQQDEQGQDSSHGRRMREPG